MVNRITLVGMDRPGREGHPVSIRRGQPVPQTRKPSQNEPRGLVPTLKYDDKPVYESKVVFEFLEDAYPDHGRKLLPSDPYSRAKLTIWTDFVTSRIIPSFQRVRFLWHPL